MTKPGARTTNYYDDENYNLTARSDPKGYVYGSEYDKDNRTIRTMDPLKQTEGITYDPGSRVTSIKDKMGLNGLADKAYQDIQAKETDHPVQMGYNVMGQRISMEDIMGGSSFTYCCTANYYPLHKSL